MVSKIFNALFMKKFNSKLTILILFVETFLILGITFIVKTLDYGNYTEKKFIDKTHTVLKKAASDKDINEIIEEGGK